MRTANIGIGVDPLMSAYGGKRTLLPHRKMSAHTQSGHRLVKRQAQFKDPGGVSFDLSGDRESS